uniref:Uncharacterized protein n=1 Tax=Arundo donax TaxID=35708 RepID=A0A0A8Y4Q8_ARUDO
MRNSWLYIFMLYQHFSKQNIFLQHITSVDYLSFFHL